MESSTDLTAANKKKWEKVKFRNSLSPLRNPQTKSDILRHTHVLSFSFGFKYVIKGHQGASDQS